jgi:NADPH-dependent 2,4-dienoyl-CoA reductase/sulfur reductase-like enzyme
VLFERSDTLGGAMDWAGNYPHLPNMEMLRYQPAYHRTMMTKHGVNARLGVEATAELILAEDPDVVVIATGAAAVLPEIDGLDEARAGGFVLTIDDVLARDTPSELGSSVVVWGAGEGGELAIELKRAGHSIRLLDAGPAYTPANYIGSRGPVIQAFLASEDITVETGLTLESVRSGKASFHGSDGVTQVIATDNLVICQGRTPQNDLGRQLTGTGPFVQVIGDARRPRSYANAIHEAAYLVRQI